MYKLNLLKLLVYTNHQYIILLKIKTLTQMTLYERLGGAGAIEAVVEGMYAKIFTDPELTDFFRKTD